MCVACYLTPGGYSAAPSENEAQVQPDLAITIVAIEPRSHEPPAKPPEPPPPELSEAEASPLPPLPEPEPPMPMEMAREPLPPPTPEEPVAWELASLVPPDVKLEFAAPAALPTEEPVAQEPPAQAAPMPPAVDSVQEPASQRGSDQAVVTSPVPHAENPPPSYPRLARRLGHEGLVVLSVRVSEAGVPLTVEVKHSSGHATLDDAALAAVWQWRFNPATSNGTPAEADVQIPIRFRLTD